MRNKGMRHYRTSDNPLERRYAEAWDLINRPISVGHSTLDYLLAEEVNCPCGEVTDRDKLVAATVVQWLGTPVGRAFVANVLGINEYQG